MATETNRDFDRKLMEAKYRMFDHFALSDQRIYYNKSVSKNRHASAQVNFIRAACALFTIIVTGLATYIVQTQFISVGAGTCGSDLSAPVSPECSQAQLIVNILLVLSVTFPALGAFFNMLSDLYQWDRLIKVYDEAEKSLEVPDAMSPDPRMDDTEYRTNLLAYATGTLKVMRDETAQWGQLIRPSEDLEQFRIRADKYYRDLENQKLGRPPSTDDEGPDQPRP